MLSYKLFGAGIQGLAVTAIGKDVATGISASGSTQGTATVLTCASNQVTNVAGGSGVILDPNASFGDSQLVYNGVSNPLKVYPPVGASINGLTTNSPVILPINTACEFHCFSTTSWTAILSR